MAPTAPPPSNPPTGPARAEKSPLRVLFFGTPEFAAVPLRALLLCPEVRVCGVITQPDRPAGRGQGISAPPVKQLAIEHQLPTFQPRSLRKELESFNAFVEQVGPIDLGIVVAFGQILPAAVLTVPRLGCLNIHASLLPRWRGAAPIQRAIFSGDRETGVCLMQMDEGLDTGPVLIDARTPIGQGETFGELHNRLAQLGADLLCSNISKIAAKALNPTPQPGEGLTYAQKITPQECEIDWSQCAHVVSAKIRALSPFPGAFTWLGSQRLKVLGATTGPCTGQGFPAGTIIRADPSGIAVQCGTIGAAETREAQVVLLSTLQLEGRKRLSAGDFLRGVALPVGTQLGRAASTE